jgi:hypothetical protein
MKREELLHYGPAIDHWLAKEAELPANKGLNKGDDGWTKLEPLPLLKHDMRMREILVVDENTAKITLKSIKRRLNFIRAKRKTNEDAEPARQARANLPALSPYPIVEHNTVEWLRAQNCNFMFPSRIIKKAHEFNKKDDGTLYYPKFLGSPHWVANIIKRNHLSCSFDSDLKVFSPAKDGANSDHLLVRDEILPALEWAFAQKETQQDLERRVKSRQKSVNSILGYRYGRDTH